MPLSRANLGPLLSLSFSSNNDLNKLATAQWKYNMIQCLLWQPQQLFFHWYYVKEIFSNIRIKFFPTSRNLQSFLQVHNIIWDLVLRVEAVHESASFIFLYLQCDSESRNFRFSQSISWLVCITCWAILFVFVCVLIAYSCWYLCEGNHSWVSPR